MRIGFILFPNVTQLDFTGPLQLLQRMPDTETFVLAKDKGPLKTDGALTVLPTHSFDEAPQLDMICVPGGFGTADAISDSKTLGFVRDQGAKADYVTSVCTGALILGAAGLLKGKKATTHWAYTDLLALCGATYTEGRVVRDGNIFTGGGVTAGIDFALTLIAALHGEDMAQAFQLGFEYNPQPPFNSGHPSTAPADILTATRPRYEAQQDVTARAIEGALKNA
ncbi:MAG: DJ-1/PfpI family protein [Pseudomonadota bacterium]